MNKKMGLIIHARPFKKVFVKRNPLALKQQNVFSFIKHVRKQIFLKKKNFVKSNLQLNIPYKQPRGIRHVSHTPHISHPPKQGKFEYIKLNSNGNVPKTILTDLPNYDKYVDFTIVSIPTDILHDNENISKLLNIYWFLYNNGGIYLNKEIKVHPSMFKKNDFIAANIDLFSCEKESHVMKKIIDDAYDIIIDEGNMDDIMRSFYKNIEGHQFNKIVNFLI